MNKQHIFSVILVYRLFKHAIINLIYIIDEIKKRPSVQKPMRFQLSKLEQNKKNVSLQLDVISSQTSVIFLIFVGTFC